MPSPLPPGFGWLFFVAFGIMAATYFVVMAQGSNGDYIDEHQGRGSVEDNWALPSADEILTIR